MSEMLRNDVASLVTASSISEAGGARAVYPIGDQRFTPSGFMVLRSPLLPFSELWRWSADLAAPGAASSALDEALRSDRGLLRERLRAILARPEVVEGLFLASPDLEGQVQEWLTKPDDESSQRVERALVRYFSRMCARPTPFGLFAGCTVGAIGGPTELKLVGREEYRRRTRLDMDYMSKLVASLEQEPAIRQHLRFYPSNSLYSASGRLRYIEARVGPHGRTYHLVAIQPTPPIDRALVAARDGKTRDAIADAVIQMDPEIERCHALTFVDQLVEAQVLVSEITLRVTGRDVHDELVDWLDGIPDVAHLAGGFRKSLAHIRTFDDSGLGIPPSTYREFASDLERLPAAVELKSLVQVDLYKPAQNVTLGPEVIQELARAADILYRFARQPDRSALDKFVEEFRARYDDAAVPLLEALDEDFGIGFMRSSAPVADGAPLLAKLPFATPPAEEKVAWSARDALLLGKYSHSLAAGGVPIQLTKDDLRHVDRDGRAPLPDAMVMIAALQAESEAACKRGEFRLRVTGLSGPSGACLLGRFCHLSDRLTNAVQAHLRAEEAHRPDAIFAEVVHLPEGRVGNILFRPLLRAHEIPFLARPGVSDSRCIPVQDLVVQLVGDRVLLRSRRLDREVIPRLTTAHNFGNSSLGIYRFLAQLQSQGVLGGASWTWGALDSAPFLPQVKSGRIVLSEARWRVSSQEIKELTRSVGAPGFKALQEWRCKRGIPRWVELVEGDNLLALDLENAIAGDVLIHEMRSRSSVVLREWTSSPDNLIATGPEGAFCHEMLIPFERVQEDVGRPQRTRPLAATAPEAASNPSRFEPGSEWLFAKLYCGSSDADRILREVVAPLVERMTGLGAVRQWFFIRYGDPEWHLRVRFRGDPALLTSEVLPALHRGVMAAASGAKVRRIMLDTYDREVDRYGGPLAIEAAEDYFQADSMATLNILNLFGNDEGAEVRWRIAILGVDAMLNDFDTTPEDRRWIVRAWREMLWKELGHKPLKIALGDRFREKRQELEQLLDPTAKLSEPLEYGRRILAWRAMHSKEPIRRLRDLEAAGALSHPLREVVGNLVHMYMNRMMRSGARAHELVVHDFLGRIYESSERRGSSKA